MVSALVLGLAGSFHCIGMCAPLTLALPLPFGERLRAAGLLLTYHAGRILTYAALGLLFGLLGKGLVLAGWQQAISVVLGVAMLLAGIGFWLGRSFSEFEFFGKNTPVRTLYKSLSKRFQARSKGLFVAGLLNGLLPCGMVYVALAGAIASTSGWESAMYMAIFGAGTLPALLAVGLLGRIVGPATRQRFRWMQPALTVVAGLLLIQRGLSIDLSAWHSAVPGALFDCH